MSEQSQFMVSERGDLCLVLSERERELYKALHNYRGKYLLMNAVVPYKDSYALTYTYKGEEVE